MKGYEIPEFSRQSKGIPIVNMLEVDKDEKISTMISVKDKTIENQTLFFATKKGVVKRTALKDFERINKNGKIAINFREDDELLAVRLTDGSKDIILGTNNGLLTRFNENEIRVMGRTAAGVRGIRLRGEDEVVGLDVLTDKKDILIVTDKGYGKITPQEQYRISRRGGRGVKTATLTERNGKLIYIGAVVGDEDLMIITDYGVIIRLLVEDISVTGRATQGVRLIRLLEDQRVATVTTVKDVEEELKEVEKETESDDEELVGGMEDTDVSLEPEVDEVEEDLDSDE